MHASMYGIWTKNSHLGGKSPPFLYLYTGLTKTGQDGTCEARPFFGSQVPPRRPDAPIAIFVNRYLCLSRGVLEWGVIFWGLGRGVLG